MDGEILEKEMKRLDAVFSPALDKPNAIAKRKLGNLAERLNSKTPHICRMVARREAESPDSDMQVLVNGLKGVFEKWRAA